MSLTKNQIRKAIDLLYSNKNTHPPLCGMRTSFDKKKNICTKKTLKTTKSKTKLSRCPKGTRRNKKTKLCEPTYIAPMAAPDAASYGALPAISKFATTASNKSNANNLFNLEKRLKRLMGQNTSQTVKTTAKIKRCPKGTRRNKKTNVCEPINKSKTMKSKKQSTRKSVRLTQKPIIIPDSTPTENRTIATAISKLMRKKSSSNIFASSEVLSKLPEAVTKLPSFSPEINQKLVTIRNDVEINDIFGCGIEDALEKPLSLGEANFKEKIKIPIGINADGSLKCVGGFTKKGQNILLDNLRQSKLLDCSNIVTPLQIQSNCWFNTMFMTFFISDKGRKFFRFFRQMMITGKKMGGKNITPVKLRRTFFLLNASIEACYNKKTRIDPIKRTNWTLALDTNNIIQYIYDSIPASANNRAIVKPGELNNPLSYYKSIIHYLGDNSVIIHEISIGSAEDVIKYRKLFQTGFREPNSTPDIIAMHVMDSESKKMEKPLSFSYNGSKYVLDSVVVRDTSTSHFCAVLTCNNVEYGYDGASFSRITPFKWKDLLNKNKKWTYNGSVFVDENGKPTSSKIYWNFKKAYQLLFYYRID